MIRTLLFTLTLLTTAQIGRSQSSIYLGTSLDFGVPFANSYNQNKSVVSPHFLSYHLGGNLSAQWRFMDKFAIEVGIGQSYDSWRLKDKNFENRHEGFIVKLVNSDWSWNYYTNISYIQELNPNKLYLYSQLGYSFNNSAPNTQTQQKEFNQVKNGIREQLTATTVYAAQNTSIVPEIGIQKYVGDKHMISMGVKLNLGASNLKTGSYTVENLVDTTIINTDNYISKGSFLGFTVKYSFLLHHIPKKEKPPKVKKTKKEKPEPDTTVVVKDPPTKDPVITPVDSSQYTERVIDVTHKVKVSNPTVRIKLWDHQMVDGDRVSLNLNGDYVLVDYTLQKAMYEMDITLQEGLNRFVLHALNLGRFEPNTAAIIIMDGDKEHKIILESTLEKSGTIEITYKPEKEKKHDHGDDDSTE